MASLPRGWSRRGNSAPPFPSRCPARNPPTNRNSCSSASSSPSQEPRGGSFAQADGEEASPGLWLLRPHPSPTTCRHKGQEAAVAQQLCLCSLRGGSRKKSFRSQLAQLESRSHPSPRLPQQPSRLNCLFPKPSKPRSIKLRLLLLSFSRRWPRSGPPACPPKAVGRAGLPGTVLKHGHRQLEETPLLVPGGQRGACCSFSRRVGAT